MASKEYIGLARLTQAFQLLKDVFDTKLSKSDLSNLLTGTIAAGETSVTIQNSQIKESSVVDIYFEDKVMSPTSVTVSNGSITIGIEAQSTATNVGVRCL